MIDVLGYAKKVKCSYCSKIITGRIFRFKHHIIGTSNDSGLCTQVLDVKLIILNVVEDGGILKLEIYIM